MDWPMVVAGITAVGGAIWYGVTWIAGKLPTAADKAGDLATEVIKRIQGDASPGTITRLEALEHAEALASYLDGKSSKAGTEALQTVVLAILEVTPKG